MDTSQIKAIDPAPLTEEPKGVLFGGDDESKTDESGAYTSGRKSLKIAKDNSVSNSKSGDAPKAVSPKSAIRKSFTPKR
ncbi:hypothetical protein YpEc11_26 [Yersinia phage vB_YpEc11]|uniref:Uncharacterized protein n=1 Tax=Yersinia phage vB_YpEc11 TaxID=3056113 RepID=A0AA51VHA6_9CAUD|nr:hypothetical protein YpEc11_26 [Yersinia phage vB_YpEc11]